MNLAPLLEPRSVAVVGANDRPGSYADGILRNLKRAEFEGPVWGVNPKRDEVLGFPCVPSVADLPEAVDAVVVAIPAAGVAAVIAEAGERGCGGAVVISAGFGEVESGRAHEAELREAALAHDLPVCGPNGNGIVAVRARAAMWGDSVAPLEPGAVAMITQSGNVGVNALGSHRGIRWHTVVSTGNQTVCDASDWLAALAGADGVRSVALFLESDGDGTKLAEALAQCAEGGIGVAVLKVGASAAGAVAAAAHTGSLAGDQRVFRALVEEAGGAWAENPHELLELARVQAEPRARARDGGGLAVLTCSGGDSGIAADEAERLGVELPPLGPATRGRLEELLPPAATIANPLDYTAMIWGDSDRLAPDHRGGRRRPGDRPAAPLLRPPARPLAGVRGVVGGGPRRDRRRGCEGPRRDRRLLDPARPDRRRGDLGARRQGVPLVAGLRNGAALRAGAARGSGRPGPAARDRGRGARVLAGTPRPDNGWIGEAEAKRALRGFGVPVPDGRIASGPEDAVAAAHEIGWPVALKLSGAHMRHKSDAGAIALGPRERRRGRCRVATSPRAPAGPRAPSSWSSAWPSPASSSSSPRPPTVSSRSWSSASAGSGPRRSTTSRSSRCPPSPSASSARSARSVELPLLTGARGAEPVDLGAVAQLASGAGQMLLNDGLALLELNPVVARPDGAIALDALARRGNRGGTA